MPWVKRRVSIVNNYIIDDWFQDQRSDEDSADTSGSWHSDDAPPKKKHRRIPTRHRIITDDEEKGIVNNRKKDSSKDSSTANDNDKDTSPRKHSRRNSRTSTGRRGSFDLQEKKSKSRRNSQKVFRNLEDQQHGRRGSLTVEDLDMISLADGWDVDAFSKANIVFEMVVDDGMSEAGSVMDESGFSQKRGAAGAHKKSSVSDAPTVQRFVDYEDYKRMQNMLQTMSVQLQQQSSNTRLSTAKGSIGRAPPPRAKKKAPPRPPPQRSPGAPPPKKSAAPIGSSGTRSSTSKTNGVQKKPDSGIDSGSSASDAKKQKPLGSASRGSRDEAAGRSGSRGSRDEAAAHSKKNNSAANDLANDPSMQKYVKMKKIGMPIDSIVNRMRMDKIAPDTIAKFTGQPVAGATGGGGAAAGPSPDEILASNPALKKYAMLKKMGTPLHAIINRMRVDGVAPTILAQLEQKSSVKSGLSVQKEARRQPSWIFQPKKGPQKKLKGVHWSKIEYDEKEGTAGTVWEKVHKEIAKKVELDQSELESMFEIRDPSSKKKGGKADKKKSNLIQLLDGKRSFNISVGLSRIGITYPEIRSALLLMDTRVLPLDMIEKLKAYVPTNRELDMIRNFDGDISKLDRPEKFFLSLVDFHDLPDRLDLWTFSMEFDETIQKVSGNLGLVCLALDRIKQSSSLKNILAAILSIGNFINNGTHRGKAFGFKLSSIEVLDKTKTSNGQMSLLMYVVKTVEKNFEDSMYVYQELKILEDVIRFKQSALKEEIDDVTKKTTMLSKKLRKQKMSMIKLESTWDTTALQQTAQEMAGTKAQDLFEARMATFLQRAVKEQQMIVSEYKRATELNKDVLKFFGENKKLKWEQLFAIVQKFTFLFEKAKKDLRGMEERTKREADQKAKKKARRIGGSSRKKARQKAKANDTTTPATGRRSSVTRVESGDTTPGHKRRGSQTLSDTSNPTQARRSRGSIGSENETPANCGSPKLPESKTKLSKRTSAHVSEDDNMD